MITKMIATINVNGAMILLTATMELIVEMSSVELFGPNVLRFKILSVLVPASTGSKSLIASLIEIFTNSMIFSFSTVPTGLYPADKVFTVCVSVVITSISSISKSFTALKIHSLQQPWFSNRFHQFLDAYRILQGRYNNSQL